MRRNGARQYATIASAFGQNCHWMTARCGAGILPREVAYAAKRFSKVRTACGSDAAVAVARGAVALCGPAQNHRHPHREPEGRSRNRQDGSGLESRNGDHAAHRRRLGNRNSNRSGTFGHRAGDGPWFVGRRPSPSSSARTRSVSSSWLVRCAITLAEARAQFRLWRLRCGTLSAKPPANLSTNSGARTKIGYRPMPA